MKFNRDAIINFINKKRMYCTWRKKLDQYRIRRAFYPYFEKNVQKVFPDKDIQTCAVPYFSGWGADGYKLGFRYTNETGTYYLFTTAFQIFPDKVGAPDKVAVGKVVDGNLYLLEERFLPMTPVVSLKVISEEEIAKRELQPKWIHDKSIYFNYVTRSDDAEFRESITDEDIKCLKIAYEGVRAFSKLIGEWEQCTLKPGCSF